MAGALMVALPDNPTERLAALFDAHYERLYRSRAAPCAGGGRGARLVQETFLKAAGAPRSVPSDTHGEEAWLVRVLINIRRDQWRRQEVRARHDRDLMAPAHAEAQQESALIAHATVWGALDRSRRAAAR